MNPGDMKGVELRAIFAKTHSATKIPTLFFYHSIVRFSLAEENRQLEKLELPEKSKRLYEIVG
jgi:hypothetical protein